MRGLIRTRSLVLLAMLGGFPIEFHSFGACNAPNSVEVTWIMSGPDVVAVGSTNEYYLGYVAPGNVDVSGGEYIWTYPADFKVVGSNTANPIKLVAPATPSTSLNDKTIHCEFSKKDWISSGPIGCEDEKKVTVVKVEVSASSLEVDPYKSVTTDGVIFQIDGKADWIILLEVTPAVAKSKVDARHIQTVCGSSRAVYRNPPAGVVGLQNDMGTVWHFDGKNGEVAPGSGPYIILSNSDTPKLGVECATYSSIQRNLTFENFIQYKLGTGVWITLEKGSWETHGSAVAQSDGSGGYTSSGGQTSTLISDFVSSSDSAVENPIAKEPGTDPLEGWEEY